MRNSGSRTPDLSAENENAEDVAQGDFGCQQVAISWVWTPVGLAG